MKAHYAYKLLSSAREDAENNAGATVLFVCKRPDPPANQIAAKPAPNSAAARKKAGDKGGRR